MFCRNFGHSKGAYIRLLLADLGKIVTPLDSPFRAPLESVILFDSEMHPKIEKHQGYKPCYSLVLLEFWPFYRGLYSAPVSSFGQESNITGFAFPSSTRFVISFDSETHLIIEKHQGYSLGVLSEFWRFQRGL